jgi:hypothetical protein
MARLKNPLTTLRCRVILRGRGFYNVESKAGKGEQAMPAATAIAEDMLSGLQED